jgi:hypothetical protein
MAGNVSHVPVAMTVGERHQPADKRETELRLAHKELHQRHSGILGQGTLC